MIASLRRRHRVMTIVMGAAALTGLGVAINSRPPEAIMPALPSMLVTQPSAPAASMISAGKDLWQGAKLETRIYPDQVELTVLEPLYRPDPLLYWAPSLTGAQLPNTAVLLGPVSNSAPAQRYKLPQQQGALLLFSLAHGEVFATAALGSEPSP